MKIIIAMFLGIMMTLPYTQAEDRKRVFTKKQMEQVVAVYVGDIPESDLGRDEGLGYFYMKAHIEGLIYGIKLVDSVSPPKKPIMSTKEDMEIMKDFQKFLQKQTKLKDDADGYSLLTYFMLSNYADDVKVRAQSAKILMGIYKVSSKK